MTRIPILIYAFLLNAGIQLLPQGPVMAQNINEIKITLEAKNESLKNILTTIGEKTNLRISFLDGNVEPYANINLPLDERTVKEVLDLVLAQTPLTYRQVNNYLFIEREADENEDPTATPPLKEDASLLFNVTGKVTDGKNNQPIAGANIIVKGTTRGITTNAQGRFSIDANSTDILVFSFIGYKTFQTPVGARVMIDVVMEEDIAALKEVVVNAGYWQVADRERTGNISRVSAEEIQNHPVSNPLAALEGQMPGIYIAQKTGVPGGAFTVQIRGKNNLRLFNANEPLYIVDGVPFTSVSLSSTTVSIGITGQGNPLSSINPADIESIEILKDADATSIYGSRGANGVVLITTKKGKPEKTKAAVNFYTGVGEVTRMMDLLNTKQYLEMRREAFKNDGATPQPSDYDLVSWDTTRYTDWQKEILGGTAHVTNAQVSVSGGSKNTQFYMGGGYYRETTVFPGDFVYKKASTHFNVTHTSPDRKFDAIFSATYVAENNNLPGVDNTYSALVTAPNAPAIYDEKGNLNWENGTFYNPFYTLHSKYKANTENLIANAILRYELFKDLHIKTSLGYTRMQLDEISIYPKSILDPTQSPTSGFVYAADNRIKTWIIEPQLTYHRTHGQDELDVLVGATFQQNVNEGEILYATDFSSDALLENISAAGTVRIFNTNYTQYRYNGIFGRIHYGLLGKYFVNLTARRDGSSRFGPGKRFANFGAIGVAWIFSNEELLKRSRIFSFGKLRASYGTTGSDQISDYQYLDTWKPVPNPYQGIAGLVPERLFNANYRWETNKKLEAALDLGFFKDRVLLSASYYHNRSSSQLVGYPLPYITGFFQIQSNLDAKVQNTGVELELSTINIKSENFRWISSLNLTVPRNKLVSYPNLDSSPYANIYEEGKSLFISKAFHYTGVNPKTGEYKFEDFNRDEIISFPDDLQAIKTVAQDYYGGFHNSLQYKNWQLDVLFQFVKQTGYNYLYYGFDAPGIFGFASNQPVIVMDRWQKPGDDTDIQRFSQDYGTAYEAYINASNYGDNAISDASFIRFKNISLSYRLPVTWMQKIHLQDSRLYIRAQNLFTITDYLGMDPENQRTDFLPPLRMITAGIHLTF